jgi:hypothetical protein
MYVHSIFTIKANNHHTILMSFTFVHQKLNNCCLMCFNTAENESSILSRIEHTPWQIEAQTTTNTLRQFLHQGHISCTRSLHRGITFQTPLIFNSLHKPKEWNGSI